MYGARSFWDALNTIFIITVIAGPCFREVAQKYNIERGTECMILYYESRNGCIPTAQKHGGICPCTNSNLQLFFYSMFELLKIVVFVLPAFLIMK